MGGGGKTETEYTSSPEQQAIMRALMPLIQGLSGYGQRGMGGEYPEGAPSTLGQPSAPQMPSAEGVLTGTDMYKIPEMAQASPYDVPDIYKVNPYALATFGQLGSYDVPGAVLPSKDWYGSMSPEVMEGVWAPYQEGAEQMLEAFGGTAGAGISGAHAAAMGKYFADASKDVGLQAWQMSQPGMMAEWQAQVGRGRDIWGEEAARQRIMQGQRVGAARDVWGEEVARQNRAWEGELSAEQLAWMENQRRYGTQWGEELQREKLGHQYETQESMMDYQNEMQRLQQQYGIDVQAWGLPFTILQALQGATPQAVVSQQPGALDWLGTLGPLGLGAGALMK